MISIALKIDTATPAFKKIVSKLGDLSSAMQSIGAAGVSSTRRNFDAGTTPYGEPWKPLKLRQGDPLKQTGRMMMSITSSLSGSGASMGVTIGSNYGRQAGGDSIVRLHHFGGVIRPKNAKALAIPLTKAAMNAGSPRGFGGLRLVWPKGKKHGWLVEGSKKSSVIHYLLVKSVNVPARQIFPSEARGLPLPLQKEILRIFARHAKP